MLQGLYLSVQGTPPWPSPCLGHLQTFLLLWKQTSVTLGCRVSPRSLVLLGTQVPARHDWVQHQGNIVRCSLLEPTWKLIPADPSMAESPRDTETTRWTSRVWADSPHTLGYALGRPSEVPAEDMAVPTQRPASGNRGHHDFYPLRASLFRSDTYFRNVKILRAGWW